MNDVNQSTNLDEFLDRKPVSANRRRWKWVATALGVALLLLVAGSLLFGGRDQPNYITVSAQRRDLSVDVTATGNLQPTNQIEVGSETSGLVEAVFVDVNDQVRRGQPLARIDTSRLADSEAQARAAVASARAQVASAEASLAQSRADYSRLQEVARLSDGKVPSKAELDTGLADVRRNEAQLRANRAAVDQAIASLSSARTALAKATIYSPVSGIVLARKVDPGQTVAASFETPELFTIAEDLSRMRIDVKVDEADIALVKLGQPARFSVDAYPGRTFPARVERVDVGATSTEASASGAASGSVVSYVTRLIVDNQEGLLRPGMTATASIITEQLRGYFIVPLAALRFQPPQKKESEGLTIRPPDQGGESVRDTGFGRGSRRTIYVINDEDRLAPLSVTIVATAGSSAAVTGTGLRQGMRIVTGGSAEKE